MHSPTTFPLALARLAAPGPLPALKQELALFGQFVGAWDMEVAFFGPDGAETYRQHGEWTFGWVLDGRAIQDVLIYPNAKLGMSDKPGARRIGTSLRHYDPESRKWRVVWLGATSGTLVVLQGGAVGAEIHLEGPDVDGSRLRWQFSEIAPKGFRWRGFNSTDGEHWRLEQEMVARRRS